MHTRTRHIPPVLCLLTFSLLAAAQTNPPGLTLTPDGAVLKDGKPVHAIGINYFNAFTRTLENPDDTSYREGFAELARRGIPFIRFNANGFWPKDWRLYLDQPEEFFRRLDTFVKDAETAGIGLIPSLFWTLSTPPDVVQEPCNQWGNPDSKTIALMRQFTRALVTRYLQSPAIWAWEFGNEYNLAADLPDPASHRPPIVPHWGSPATRSEADDIQHDMLITAFTEFAKTIRAIDSTRPITTGNSIPRAAAQHLRASRSWEPDTPDQFAANLLETNPSPINLVSIHLYPEPPGRFGRQDTSYNDILTACQNAVHSTGKALFAGEFGAVDNDPANAPDWAPAQIKALIEAIRQTGVPLAAFWVYDLNHQEDMCSVTPANKRAYVLDLLSAANKP